VQDIFAAATELKLLLLRWAVKTRPTHIKLAVKFGMDHLGPLQLAL
jgi:hypothetical protein